MSIFLLAWPERDYGAGVMRAGLRASSVTPGLRAVESGSPRLLISTAQLHSVWNSITTPIWHVRHKVRPVRMRCEVRGDRAQHERYHHRELALEVGRER
jgi:hypothetical protein